MSALIPEKVKDVYKDIEQKAIEYAISKIKSTDVIKTKIEDLKKLERCDWESVRIDEEPELEDQIRRMARIWGDEIDELIEEINAGNYDFIHIHYKLWSYPHFNIADMCIVVGVIIMMIQLFFEHRSDHSK